MFNVKANIHSGSFLTVRYGSEWFLLFSRNIFDTWTVHLFTCAEQNWSKRFKKKVEFNPTFFLNRRGSFRNTFFLSNDSLQWVMWHVFKRCEQTRCQRNIFFYLNFFCLCSIIFYSYVFVLFILYFVETVPYRSDPFQMDIPYWIRTERFTEPNRTKPLKKNRSGYSP